MGPRHTVRPTHIYIYIYIHIYTCILQVLALRAALWEQNGTLPTPGEWKSRKDKGIAEVYYMCRTS